MSFIPSRATLLGLLIVTASATSVAQTTPVFWMTTPDYQVVGSIQFGNVGPFFATERGPGIVLSDRLKTVNLPQIQALPAFDVVPLREAPLEGAVVMNLGELIFTETAAPASQVFLQGVIIADGEVVYRFNYALKRNPVIESATLNAGYFSLETEPVLIPSFRHLSITDLWLGLYPSDGGAIFSTGSAEFALTLYVGEVPEPSSALMLATGLAFIGWRRRRHLAS